MSALGFGRLRPRTDWQATSLYYWADRITFPRHVVRFHTALRLLPAIRLHRVSYIQWLMSFKALLTPGEYVFAKWSALLFPEETCDAAKDWLSWKMQ